MSWFSARFFGWRNWDTLRESFLTLRCEGYAQILCCNRDKRTRNGAWYTCQRDSFLSHILSCSCPECGCSTETIFRIGRASRIANEKPAQHRKFQVTGIRNGTAFINPLAREFRTMEFCSTAWPRPEKRDALVNRLPSSVSAYHPVGRSASPERDYRLASR